MRVFVTGASGFVGSAVVQDLIAAGHQVVGLARSDSSAKALVAAGAKAFRGDLEDLESLRRGASDSDGVIHTGFIHDFARFKEVCEIDRKVIEALGSALVGSKRPLIVTSGAAIVNPGRLATEKDIPISNATSHPRVASEEAAKAVAEKGVHVSVVRLAPSVHGKGDHGFVPMLIDMAREKGVSAYVGEGQNRWTALHRLDAAPLYRLAFEKAAKYTNYHGVAEQEIAFKDIAEAIGKNLKIPVVSLSSEEAAKHFTWFVHFTKLDCPASSKMTQEALGWRPKHATLMQDLAEGSYF